MRGLIIDEPWISLILAGEKTWEMRKATCNVRGPVALIRKGSGQVVGVVDIVGSLPALEDGDAYARAEPFHCIPAAGQVGALRDGWRTPWLLANARPLSAPVRYAHPSGAVIWVNLDPSVAAAVEVERGVKSGIAPEPSPAKQAKIGSSTRIHETANKAGATEDTAVAKATVGKRARIQGRIEGDDCIIPISQGNIDNSHVYLRSVLSFFPEDAVGGSDSSQPARRLLTVSFDRGRPIKTDIAGPDALGRKGKSAHYFFREARTAVLRVFFDRNRAKADDEVVIHRESPYAYDVSLRKPVRL
jgi:hypothetical protein